MVKTENIYDIWGWVLRVVVSCENMYHVKACERLINNFYNKYGDWQLTRKLYMELYTKIHQLKIN